MESFKYMFHTQNEVSPSVPALHPLPHPPSQSYINLYTHRFHIVQLVENTASHLKTLPWCWFRIKTTNGTTFMLLLRVVSATLGGYFSPCRGWEVGEGDLEKWGRLGLKVAVNLSEILITNCKRNSINYYKHRLC